MPDTVLKVNNVRPKKLIWRLYSAFLLLIVIPALLFTWYTTSSFRNFFITSTVEGLTERAHQIGSHMEGVIDDAPASTIDSLCKVLAKDVPTRFTVIAPDGRVLGDSRENPAEMDNHGNRREVLAALSGKIGISDRFSNTLKTQMIYVAVPMYTPKGRAGVIRTALSTSVIQQELSKMYGRITFGFLILAVIAALVSLIVSRNISQPIGLMKSGAQRIASGDFSIRLHPSGCEEIDLLAASLNEMSTHLKETISTLKMQHNQIDAVLSSMVEGVIAIDNEQKIIAINQAAIDLFAITRRPKIGTWIGEVVRNADLNDFIRQLYENGELLEGEAHLPPDRQLYNGGDRLLQLHGNALRDSESATIGVLVVINDVTRLKRLETMRSDFVANVSHELRTPLTSVKGFVETLQSGTLDDRKEVERFLGIIRRQVDRLSTIVEDLLALSRLEQETRTHSKDLENALVKDIFDAVFETCSTKAKAKNIAITFEYERNLRVMVEPSFMEEAIVNLLDNAVNYSPEGSHVLVKGAQSIDNSEVVFSVKDEGPGIAAKHHDRLFERFYRVDKARSRKLGGTGLGLAIVKHIASLHEGRVGVNSSPGKGSTFFIIIPDKRKSEQRDNV